MQFGYFYFSVLSSIHLRCQKMENFSQGFVEQKLRLYFTRSTYHLQFQYSCCTSSRQEKTQIQLCLRFGNRAWNSNSREFYPISNIKTLSKNGLAKVINRVGKQNKNEFAKEFNLVFLSIAVFFCDFSVQAKAALAIYCTSCFLQGVQGSQ